MLFIDVLTSSSSRATLLALLASSRAETILGRGGGGVSNRRGAYIRGGASNTNFALQGGKHILERRRYLRVGIY